MLSDFNVADKVYICCGYTDLRQGIDGLSALVKLEFNLDPLRRIVLEVYDKQRNAS